MNLSFLLSIDHISIMMLGLIALVAVVVRSYAIRHLEGNGHYRMFFANSWMLASSIGLFAMANHVILFWGAWLSANYFLIQLLAHKKKWKAAQSAAFLTQSYLLVGSLFLGAALALLWFSSGSLYIDQILNHPHNTPSFLWALVFLMLAAMVQSAIIPFHGWLLSSLNAPTPVSALMHAGLVNGGGFLLVRFSPLLLQQPYFLNALFVVGMVTVCVASVWHLVQTDIKRMLACSTIAQMGFMLVQCGMGLFSAALAHVVCHGIFKSYLFLSSTNLALEKKTDLPVMHQLDALVLALLSVGVSYPVFCFFADLPVLPNDTQVLVLFMGLLSAFQVSMALLQTGSPYRMLFAVVGSLFCVSVYGGLFFLFETVLLPHHFSAPQPLSLLHVSGLLVLSVLWFFSRHVRTLLRRQHPPEWLQRVYVASLNASQPFATTRTTYRNDYDFS